MDFWPEFLASSWGREFVAGGCGGTAGIIAGYPLDTLRIRQQQTIPHSGSPSSSSAFGILRRIVAADGPSALYRGMAAPLASVTFQNAMVFQIYAILSRAFDPPASRTDPPSYKGVALGGIGTGALQSILLSPVELLKIRLQLQEPGKSFTWSLLLYVRVHEGAVSPWLQEERPGELEDHAFRRRACRSCQLGVLLPAGRCEDQIASTDSIVTESV